MRFVYKHYKIRMLFNMKVVYTAKNIATFDKDRILWEPYE